MNKQKQIDLLNMFTDDSDTWSGGFVKHGDDIGATDRFVLITMPNEFGIETRNDKTSDFDRVLPNGWLEPYVMSAKEVWHKIASLPDVDEVIVNQVECGYCGGEGEIECPCCNNESDCNECDGTGFEVNESTNTGKKVKDLDTAIQVNNIIGNMSIIRLELLRYVLNVAEYYNTDRIEKVYGNGTNICVFKVGDAVVGVMPYRIEDPKGIGLVI